ncbi:precursor of CEP5-like [Hevea brasiliensis]|uniref:precursor of CEP5-like n=1 Tax=Hevea brasiliensis TaxID=3981 RepID=UPI0025DDBA6A|nr:precursor of CEP5-like [Hevea brasiliensis]
MAQTNLFCACVFFMLIFSQELQSIDGRRHLKLERKHIFSKLQTSNTFKKHFVDKHNVNGDNDSDVELPTTFWSPPAPPVPADAVAGMPRQPPPPPAYEFRPTATGDSPGVGHSIKN